MPLVRGEDGRMHFAAEAPGQVAAQTVSGAIVPRAGVASGNPNFDPASGRFAGPGQGQDPNQSPINRDATQQPDNGLAPEVNQYIGLITQNFAEATSMAIYPNTEGTNTVVLFDKNGARLTAFPVPNADATEEQITRFNEDVIKPAMQKAHEQRVASLQRSTVPDGVDPAAFDAHLEAIRTAARTSEDMSLADAHQFLADRGAANVDADQFLKDVREQRLDDLADVLDHQLQGKVEQIKRARSAVRVTAPSGWSKRVFAGLDDNEVIKLLTKLEGKGWDPEDIKKHVVDRIADPERKAKIEQLFGQKKLKSGRKATKSTNLSADEEWQDRAHEWFEEEQLRAPAERVNMADELAKIAEKLPQPHITINVPKQEVE